MLALFTVASAATCDPSEYVCNQLDHVVAILNEFVGNTVVHEGAKARLRPQAIYEAMASGRDALITGGCYTGGTALGHRQRVGTYDANTHTFRVRRKDNDTVFEGTFGSGAYQYGRGRGQYGDDGTIAGWSRSQFRDAAVGRWIRIRGRRGLFVTSDYECKGPNRPDQALAHWFPEDLTSTFTPFFSPERLMEVPGNSFVTFDTVHVLAWSRREVVCTSSDPSVLTLSPDPWTQTVSHGAYLDIPGTIIDGGTAEILCGFDSVDNATHVVIRVEQGPIDTGM